MEDKKLIYQTSKYLWNYKINSFLMNTFNDFGRPKFFQTPTPPPFLCPDLSGFSQKPPPSPNRRLL